MAKTQYLTYYIHLTDAARVAELQAQYPNGVNRAIAHWDSGGTVDGGAVLEFAETEGVALDFRGTADPAAGVAPFIWTPWYDEVSSSMDNPFPVNVATFSRKTGGFFGLGGTTTNYYWIGQFVYAPSATAASDTDGPELELAPIAQRRFAEGFEHFGVICGAATNLDFSRDASRHVGGLGLVLRGSTSSHTVTMSTFYGSSPTSSWERMKVRRRRAGNGTVYFWRASCTGAASAGVAIGMTPSGQLAVISTNSTAVQALLGTVGDFAIDEWARIDLLLDYNTQPNDGGVTPDGSGRLVVYVNGEQLGSFVMAAVFGSLSSNGLGTFSSSHAQSLIGNVFGVTDTNFELDVDDWVSADMPVGRAWDPATSAVAAEWDETETYNADDVVYVTSTDHVYKAVSTSTGSSPADNANAALWHRYEGLDWLNGSKLALVRPTAYSANNDGNWAGDYRTLTQVGASTSTNADAATSSTSAALAAVDTDIETVAGGDVHAVGVASIQVMCASLRGAASGSLGYAVNGAAAVDTAITQTISIAPYTVMYRPSGVTEPDPITTLELRHTKGASADAAQLRMLQAQVELLGIFGGEDYDADEADAPAFPDSVGNHNAPYPRSPWALDAASAPIGAYIVVAGTYTGNGTGQDLAFRAPVHFFWARPTSGGSGGGRWWSTMVAAHRNAQEMTAPAHAVRALENPAYAGGSGEDVQQQQYYIQVSGAHADVNAAAVTYQYVAVCDPAARFMLNGSFSHDDAGGNRTNALINSNFAPEWAFLWGEAKAAGSSAQLCVKGPGHAASAVSQVGDAAATTGALTFGTGSIVSGDGLHALVSGGAEQIAYSLWRRADGNNDPGQAAVFSIGSYTGDGAASRTITAGTAGKRPIFAFIVRENGSAAIFRDVAHTGTTSTDISAGTANAATGITAGSIDGLTVGSVLNTSAAPFNYFILWGDTTAGNGGFGVNGEFVHVEADSAADGPYPVVDEDDFEDEDGEGGEGEGGGSSNPDPGDLTTDIATACLSASTRLVNQALARLGVSQTITSLATEASREAESARLVYKTEIDAVLREFPWPFATRYADLVLVAGTASVPVNRDWQYAYRAPADLILARRLVVEGVGRRFNADPPPFRIGSDATGDLIYTDELEPVLEYTARVSCPAGAGDALFRSAAAWRLAAALAAPLSRDAKQADRCYAMYLRSLPAATTPAANEQQPDTTDGEPDWITGR